jgi:hypothetical protein
MTRARVSAAGRQPARRQLRAVSDPEPFVPPDRPSWFDRLAAAIDRLPGPYWAPYLLGFLVWLGLIALALSRAGAPLTLAVVYAHSLPFYGFWLLHYLDRRAAASLEDFRPAYTGSEAQLQEVLWRLTNLPATPALAVTLVAVLLAGLGSLSWDMDTLLENARRWEAVMAELYRLIDDGDLPAADRLNGTLAALERGRTAIERIPTWPWRPETLRGMVGALVLPVLIFLVQRLLGRLLG